MRRAATFLRTVALAAFDGMRGVEAFSSTKGGNDDGAPELGFRFAYARFGPETLARVGLVLDGTSIAKAGLKRGDVILGVNGAKTRSPATCDRAIAKLAAVAELRLQVLRSSKHIEIVGTVEQAASVVPAFERLVIGTPLPAIHADPKR